MGPGLPENISLASHSFRTSLVDSDQLSNEDVIIVLMGPPGSGKSRFIEVVTGTEGIVGHGLEPFTRKIAIYRITFPELPGSDILFVDTPSFDDVTNSDVDFLTMILVWIHSIQQRSIQITGFLYFHRISDNRMLGTTLKNFRLFEKIKGEDFNKIVLITTMWDQVDEETANYRERELKNNYWKAMLDRGSSTRRFRLTRQSAFEALEPILGEVSRRKEALLDQKEVEDVGLTVNQTSAVRTLVMQLEDIVNAHEERLSKIRSELKEPSLTPTELQLLMEDYQKLSLQMQRTANDAKRLKTLSPPPPTWKQAFGKVFRRGKMSPEQSRQEAEEVILWERPRTSDSTNWEQTPSPGRGKEKSLPPTGSSSPMHTNPSSLSRRWTPLQSWGSTTSASPTQSEYMGPLPSLSLKVSRRSRSLRSPVSNNGILSNQKALAWGQFLSPSTNQESHSSPQQLVPPPRSKTVHPVDLPLSSAIPSRRASTPADDRILYQGLSDRLPMIPPRRIKRSLSETDNREGQSSQDGNFPSIPRFPWNEIP